MSESFAELFEESFASQHIKPGSIITGKVVAVNNDVVIVTAGLKSEAVIPIEQFQNEKGEATVAVGDEVEVALDAVEDGFGETRLSREKAIRARTWTELEKAYEKGEVVNGELPPGWSYDDEGDAGGNAARALLSCGGDRQQQHCRSVDRCRYVHVL